MQRKRSAPKRITKNLPSSFAFFKLSNIWSFHVVVLQRNAMTQNSRALNLLFGDVLVYVDIVVCLGYVRTKLDKFGNATFFIRIGLPSTLKRRSGSVGENGTFWKRSPKWINLKTPAWCVSVDGENGTFCKGLRDNSHIILVAISSKTIMWTENNLSVFATTTQFSNLPGLVCTEGLSGEKDPFSNFIRGLVWT